MTSPGERPRLPCGNAIRCTLVPPNCRSAKRNCGRLAGAPSTHVLSLPLFEGMEPQAVADLLEGATVNTYPRDTLLFSAGELADRFYVVLSGQVKLVALTAEGHYSILEVFGPGSSFAEAAMFASARFPLTAEVMEEATLLRVSAASFLGRLQRDPRLALKMLATLSRWQRRLLRETAALKLKTPVQRVAGFLLSLVDVEDGPAEAVLPFKKVVLASRIGIEPESFSRAMARLRPLGVETRGRRIVIAEVAELRRLCAEADPS